MNIFKQCLITGNVKYKLANCLSVFTLLSAFIVLVIGLYWLLYPYKTLVINERPLRVINKEVKKGDILKYEMDYCKYTTLPATINKKFTDGIEFALPEYKVNNSEGCRTQTISTEIPQALPEGEYIIVAIYRYKVNPIRNVEVRVHTQKFKVIE